MFILKKKKRKLLEFPCISMTFFSTNSRDCTSGLLKAMDRNGTHMVFNVNTSSHPDWLSINSLPFDSKQVVYFFKDFATEIDNMSKARPRMNIG